MEVYITQLSAHVGKEVTIKGWLYNKRSSGKIRFILVRDGTGIVQCVTVKGELEDEIFELCDRIPQESSVIVRGIVQEDKRAPGGYELSLKNVTLVHEAKDYPIALQAHGIGFLMEQRHLWIRHRKQHAILRIRAEVVRAIRDFFDSRDFLLVDTPILTPTACEGTTSLFEVNYFDEKAYLTQSGQLYNEATAMAFGKVYCFGPAFRAEKSKTRRHLMEFWMVEPEMAYAVLEDVIELGQELVAYIVERVLEKRREELNRLERDISPLEKVKIPFPRISYDEAVKKLNECGVSIEWGEDFGAPHEDAISQQHDRPVIIHRYPVQCKAFYMKADPHNPKLSLSYDMIAPEGYGEIIGGGQRADDLEYLKKQIESHNLPQEAFEWYLDLRRYGSVPHAGFGLGLERTVAWIAGADHVRETIAFPRMLYRIYP